MKINIEELDLKEITLSDFIGCYNEEDIEEIKEEILNEGSYCDEWFDFYKDDDSEIVDCTLMTGYFEIINHINEMKICQDDPFIMIVKDAWYGTNSDGDEVGYISFEAFDDDDPPTLKGGEYDKKSFMTQEELDEFYELSDNEEIMYDVKYQDFFFIRTSKYNPQEWLKKWISEDYGHNKA